MAENLMEKWEARQERRRLLVQSTLERAEARRVARAAADEADELYAQTLANAIRDGVLEADLKAMGLDIVEQPRKRSASRSAKAKDAQPAAVETPA